MCSNFYFKNGCCGVVKFILREVVKNLLFFYGVLLLFGLKYSFASLQVPTRSLELVRDIF